MKRLCADCSLPSCSASCHGSGSRAHSHTRGTEKPSQYAAGRAGNTMWVKQRAGLYLLPSWWHSLLVLEATFLFSRASWPADPSPQQTDPKARSWILVPLQIKPVNTSDTEPELCVCIQALSSLALASRVPISFPIPENNANKPRAAWSGAAALTRAPPAPCRAPAPGRCLRCRFALSAQASTPTISHRDLAEQGAASEKWHRLPCLCQRDTQLWREAFWQLL